MGDHGDEEALVEHMVAYQRGEAAAFDALYGVLAGPLLGFLRSLARDATWADDLLQETFLQLHNSRHTYLPRRPVKPWVYAIARNVFLMRRRSATRRGRHESLPAEELPEVPVPAAMEALPDQDAVRRAVATLSDDRREALLLHHVLGLSFPEIAGVLGTTVGAAKVRAHRAMTELRRLLGTGRGDG